MKKPLKRTTVFLGLMALFLQSALTGVWAEGPSLKNLDDELEAIKLKPLNAQNQTQLEQIVSTHSGGQIRVDACPLESDRYKDILNKVQTLHSLFKDNCLDNDQARLNEILTSAQTIQDSLDQIQDQDSTSTDGSTDNSTSLSDISYSGSDGTTVNGNQIATVFNGINSVFLNGQCSLEENSFLNKTADIVQSFAQMGLLVPNQNGLVVAGGGLAISSILRAIDNIFTKRFNFEDIEDRQTFIKLNCGFYDIRREIEKTGMMDVPTHEHQEAIDKAKELHKKIAEQLKKNRASKKAILKKIDKAQQNFAKKRLGFLSDFEKKLKKASGIVKKEGNNIPAETFKLQVIHELSLMAPKLSEMLTTYQEGQDSSSLFDDLLKKILNKFDQNVYPDEFKKLVNKNPQSFFQKEQAQLQFHLERLVQTVNSKKSDLLKEWEKETTIEGQSVPAYIAELNKKDKEITQKLQNQKEKVTTVISRLERILSYRGYRGTDDGTESIVNILDQYQKVSSQIYGEWGQEFMMYTTSSALEENESFTDHYKKFRRKHLEDGKIPPKKERDHLQLVSACQDALPYRRNWKRANALTQQGYDFISANKELFFSDISNGFFGINSDFKNLRYHFKSAHYASLLLDGVDVDEDIIDEYITTDDYVQHLSPQRNDPRRMHDNRQQNKKRNTYIGKPMLEVSGSSNKAANLQRLIERYQCYSVLAEVSN